jgi:hypothetical protein
MCGSWVGGKADLVVVKVLAVPQWVSCLACRDKMRPTTVGQLQAWLLAHRHEHHGQWVALLGESLVASDASRKALQVVVDAHPDARRIMVAFVEPTK